MDIALNFDNGYVSHAAAVISSVCKYNKENIVFHIITDGLSNINMKNIISLCDTKNATVLFYKVNETILKSFPMGKTLANTYVSVATYFRLFISDLLPVSISRVIYLDCDIVVNGNLDALWRYKLPPNIVIGAVKESEKLCNDGPSRLKYDSYYGYFNAGVLLIQLTEMRKYYDIKAAIKYINDKRDRIKYHDQDVLNGLFHNKKVFLPIKYNVMDYMLMAYYKLPKVYEGQEKYIGNPTIIHFSGQLKPWHIECINPYLPLYFRALKNTPWEGEKLTNKYKSKKDIIIFKTKRILKNILNILGIKKYYFNPICQL